jgi:hypothetical protein
MRMVFNEKSLLTMVVVLLPFLLRKVEKTFKNILIIKIPYAVNGTKATFKGVVW